VSRRMPTEYFKREKGVGMFCEKGKARQAASMGRGETGFAKALSATGGKWPGRNRVTGGERGDAA